ncbi:hypothetical protein ES288_D12G221700v1 [Gossypium darwinii]|uniref:RING-type domain-containing protein n=1 Tax=Gossypium darwinii TaxID=34276 RepID=A0A5D2AF72_GOSDA|nr:hypothetical protein ES288_D12G221700v1 [Gossypium darwinii]
MGGIISKRSTTSQSSSVASNSYSWDSHRYAQPSYAPSGQDYVPEQRYAPPYHSYGGYAPESKRRLERKFSKIDDNYNSLEQVTDALARAGLESSNLIVGIDFTKSNEWTASTHDQEVFSFYPDETFCNGFEEVLRRYRELVPNLKLAGPTSFAPIIEMAITIVEQSGGQYHVLLIIADGQVTRSVDTERGQLGPQETKTVEAIVKASEYPLSIILVGVGDGPWDMMREFDDNIPARAFDNFQFVNFTEIMSKNMDRSRKEAEFALSALMEIPSQYKATLELNILGNTRGKAIDRVPLPPPLYGAGSFSNSKLSWSSGFHPSAPSSARREAPVQTAPPASSASDNHLCPICICNAKDMAFGCGHQTCCECGQDLQLCPICRGTIDTRIRLY